MAGKNSGLKKLFSKPNQACCSVEIEKTKPTENENCCGPSKNSNEEQRKEA